MAGLEKMIDRICSAALACGILAGLAACSETGRPATTAAPADITINGSDLYTESISADQAGNIYAGSLKGTIFRAIAGSEVAEPWIEPGETNGLLTLFGVLADEEHGLLWTCSNPDMFGGASEGQRSALKAFNLETGEFSASYDLPEGRQACNDIAIAADGSAYASETGNGQIFRLAPGASELKLFAKGDELAGIDGLAFAEDGTLYINNVRHNLVQRVERDENGAYAGLTTLELSMPVSAPDALRPLGGNRFIQSEGQGGRIAMISVDGNSATVTPLFDGVDSAPGVTTIGNAGYAIEGKIQYLVNPDLKGQDPGAFMLRAFTFTPPE